MRRLLQMMREAYLIPQPRGNVPLLRADDWFLAYRKGPFAMWALRQYVRAEQIDAVFRSLVDRYGSGEPPLPTSLDLYRELQAITPEPLRYLLVDLFEANTYWELETQQVTTNQIGTGEWQVTLDVLARKVVVDEEGVETDVLMDDLIEVGVFVGPEIEPQYVRMHRVRSGHQRITVTVPTPPARAGIDPRNLLVDLDAPNNVQEITRETCSRAVGYAVNRMCLFFRRDEPHWNRTDAAARGRGGADPRPWVQSGARRHGIAGIYGNVGTLESATYTI